MSDEEKIDRFGAVLEEFMAGVERRLVALEVSAGLRERPPLKGEPFERINVADAAMSRAFMTSEVSREMARAVGDRLVGDLVRDARRGR